MTGSEMVMIGNDSDPTGAMNRGGGSTVKRNPLSAQIKQDNLQLYVLSRSNDPSVMIPNTRKLMSNLIISAKIIYGVRRLEDIPDKDLIADLANGIRIANDAWYEYSSEKNWGYAMQECERVLDMIGDLMYNTEWADGKRDSFTTSGGKK